MHLQGHLHQPMQQKRFTCSAAPFPILSYTYCILTSVLSRYELQRSKKLAFAIKARAEGSVLQGSEEDSRANPAPLGLAQMLKVAQKPQDAKNTLEKRHQ